MAEKEDKRIVKESFTLLGPLGVEMPFYKGETVTIVPAREGLLQVKALNDQNRKAYVPPSTVDLLVNRGHLTKKE